MAKDQELLQAVKSNDLGVFRKLVAKIKAAKASKWTIELWYKDWQVITNFISLFAHAQNIIHFVNVDQLVVDIAEWKVRVFIFLRIVHRIIVNLGVWTNLNSPPFVFQGQPCCNDAALYGWQKIIKNFIFSLDQNCLHCL